MSQIVTAIDAELAELDSQLAEAEGVVRSLTDRKHGLAKLRLDAVGLNGGGTVPPSAEKPKPAPKAKTKQAPAPKVSDSDRQERAKKATDRQKLIFDYVRKHGSIDAGQAGELLGLSPEGARLVLQKLSSQTPLQRFELVPGKPRQGVEWRLSASKGDDGGPKTQVEIRVVDSVTTDGPIDEGTLAFNCNLSITDCRSVTSGLIRRGVLARREEEGVTLFEVPA